MTAAEPAAVAYTVQAPNLSSVACLEEDTIDRTPLGMFGFYTDDPVVFEQRVAEMEADMDEVDAGIVDPEKWVKVDDFWAAMRKGMGFKNESRHIETSNKIILLNTRLPELH